MEYISWIENERQVEYMEEDLEKTRVSALADAALWPESGRFHECEESLMGAYLQLKMEEALFEMGAAILAKYPDPADNWYVADVVYASYAYYYLTVRKPKEALDWYFKAFEQGLPYPQGSWKEVAACYVELKDIANADLWIEKCMEHDTKEGKNAPIMWTDFGEYYIQTGRPERGLAICQQVLATYQYPPPEIWEIMSEGYKALGDFDNAIAMLQTYVDKFSNDEGGYHTLALAVYEYKNDLPKVEALLLKAIDLVKEKPNYKNWVAAEFHNLAVAHLNKGFWEKAFSYLKQYFEWKYPPEEFEFFSNLIDGIPEFENNEMAITVYHALINFENSTLRPGNKLQVDGVASDQAAEEVKDAHLDKLDISKLTNLDETQAN